MSKKAKSSKKSVKPQTIKPVEKKNVEAELPPGAPKLPPELEKKLKTLKTKLDKFKSKVLEKFGDYIVGITLLPPEKAASKKGEKGIEAEKEEKTKSPDEQKISLLVLVDDTTSKKMTKDELHHKFSSIIK
ncbi:MAG: hypothetical protein KKH52_01055, partial [Nanoarchaeota archaeon]|nr:hypothetical protein [Nanoarchaeota archaeon]